MNVFFKSPRAFFMGTDSVTTHTKHLWCPFLLKGGLTCIWFLSAGITKQNGFVRAVQCYSGDGPASLGISENKVCMRTHTEDKAHGYSNMQKSAVAGCAPLQVFFIRIPSEEKGSSIKQGQPQGTRLSRFR